MPQLPQLGQRRVARDTRQIATYDTSAEGRALEQVGSTMARAADDLAQRQRQEQDSAAVAGVRRKLDDWERTNLYDPQNGAVAKLGRDSFDLPEKIPKSFDDFAGKIPLEGVSPRARGALQELIASRRDQALSFVDRHTFQQKQVFEEGQFKADIESSLNRSALLTDAGQLDQAGAEVKLAQSRAIGFLRSRGKSEEEIASYTKDIASKAAVFTVNQMLEKDRPTDAEEYLKKNAGSFKVEDLLRAQSAVGKAVDARQALVTAQEVVNNTLRPAVQPSDFGRLANLAGAPSPDRLTELVKQTESGGKRFGADGKLLTSSKGAQGEMQVMPATARNPGYGIAPVKDNSPDELARVGREYLGAMVKEFDGDVRKALAAYNAGPGRVQQAMKEAEADAQRGAFHGGVPADYWLTKMPAETQAYVAKIAKQFGEGAGQPQMPTLQSLHDEVRKRIPVDQPQRLKLALDETTRQYEDMLKAKKQQEDQNTAAAMDWLEKNGGRYSHMPANLRANVPPKERDNVMNYGARVAKGDDVTDPIVFQKMATDDKWLKGLTDAEFFLHSRKLSQSDAEQMALRRGKLLNKEVPEGKGPGDMDAGSLNAILNNRLQQLGMDPTPKDGTSDAGRVGAIRQFVWNETLRAQKAAGKRFNDVEISSHIDKLFAQNVTFQTSFLGINTGTKSQRLLGMSAGDIPGDIKDRLKKDFKAAGITDPTDSDLLGAYLQLRVKR